VARLLLEQNEPSGAVVLAFYSALHWIDAYLATRGLHPDSHLVRNRWTASLSDLKPAIDAYSRLRVRSEWVRYLGRRLTKDEAEALLTGQLESIKVHVKQLIEDASQP
jgi:hypothetical protein